MEVNIILLGFKRLFSEGIKELLDKRKYINTDISHKSFSQVLNSEKLIKNTDIILVKNNTTNNFLGSEILDLKKINSKLKVVAIGENYESELSQALSQNVDGFLHFDIDSKTLLEAINNIVKDDFYIEPSSRNHYINLLSVNDSSKKNKLIRQKKLTKRELQILQLICEENTTKDISTKLCISSRTVDNHRKNLLQKTESKSSIGLVLFAINHNLFSPEIQNQME